MTQILITRPERQAHDFARALVNRGISDEQLLVSPVLQIKFVDTGLVPQNCDAVIFTSSNGVVFGADRLAQLDKMTAYCVGTKTTNFAKHHGLNAICAGHDVAGLIDFIKRGISQRNLMYLRGAHVRADLVGRLNGPDVCVGELIVYDQVAQKPSPDALRLIKGGTPVLVPLFSKRSAELLMSEDLDWSAHTAICISEAVADTCVSDFANVIVARTPDWVGMVDAVIKENTAR